MIWWTKLMIFYLGTRRKGNQIVNVDIYLPFLLLIITYFMISIFY
jgi:hypothetical protein